MKKTIWLLILLAVVLGFFVGKYLYKKEDKYNNTVKAENKNHVNINNHVNAAENTDILTNAKEIKISINTKIIEQIYYNNCGHLIETQIRDTSKYINMREESFAKQFSDWEIKKFTEELVVAYKEMEDCCNEHFLAKDVDGYVTIYILDRDGNILELLTTTEIPTKYLTEADKNSLKDGITVYTKQNLNKLIQDFE